MYVRVYIIRGILTETQESRLSADDGGLSGAKADGKSQATARFDKDPVWNWYLRQTKDDFRKSETAHVRFQLGIDKQWEM